MLRRIRKCLAGVLPPPSVTIPQLDLVGAVLSKKNDIFNFINDIKNDSTKQIDCSSTSASSSARSHSLLRPSHSLEETKNMPWRDILSVRQHGLCYNLNRASESNEYLSLAVMERFIGAETASTYTNSPSSAKKRSTRLKKIKSRRKATPKRMTPASKKKNRKASSASAKKRLNVATEILKTGPSRESSKRALFQSPCQTKNCRTQTATHETRTSNSSSSSYFAPSTTTQLDVLLKRKRNQCDDYDDVDTSELTTQSSKLLKSNDSTGLTPRALKIKSESFCIGAGSSRKYKQQQQQLLCASSSSITNSNTSLYSTSSSSSNSQQQLARTSSVSSLLGSKLQKSYSESMAATNSLTENQRKTIVGSFAGLAREKNYHQT
ncbi:hypothetical protein EVAR_101359_1 [Eumeta japonica]|uniref:Uncharacterized protein n=1 Tax=Eumeta variegata TaxID=151549 RepID=A0A4C1TAJ9_EUMVA|nr:hypothetical protein EVAR_101359_1 [Eumeta japonica]